LIAQVVRRFLDDHRPQSRRKAAFWIALAGVTAVAFLAPARAQSGSADRVAILTGAHARYQAASQTLKAELDSRKIDTVLIELPDGTDSQATEAALQRLTATRPTVVAAAGETATKLALQALPETPVAYFMVPNAADAEFTVPGGDDEARVAGIAADVSPEQQLGWIKRLQPECRKLAVLHSAATRLTVQSLRETANRRGIEIVDIHARKDEFAQALSALSRSGSDAVLMLPDPRVYNAPNAKELILWGLRERKPVWTFSRNIVKAGAFAGQSVAPAEIGRQAAGIVSRMLAGQRPSQIGLKYATTTEKAVNLHTAERLRISVDDELEADVVRMGETS
jgi:putative ABC transport system substrate-binding protein